MAVINVNRLFLQQKQKSVPVVKTPRHIREMLNIDEVEENGIFKIEPGQGLVLYDRCYIFEDINYKNKDRGEKEGILLQLMNWLNAMKVSFKLTVSNQYRDMDRFIREIFVDTNREEYPGLAQGQGQWLSELLEKGSPELKKVMYLTVTCRVEGFPEAANYFNTLETQLQMLFNGWRSGLYRLGGRERLQILYQLFHLYEPGTYEPQIQIRRRKSAWKNDILPAKYEGFDNFMIFDKKQYVSVLFGHNYDNSIDEGSFLSGFYRKPYPLLITQDVVPVERRLVKDKLSASHMNTERSISSEIDTKRNAGQLYAGVSWNKSRKKDEIEYYTERIDENDESGFFMGLLIAVFAEDEDTLAQRVEDLRAIGKENGVLLDTYDDRQLKAFNTALPIGGRQVDYMRFFLTSSMVAFHPYYAKDIMEIGGQIYGRNRTTGNLIIGNRKLLKNPHGIILGHTGSGKSFIIKTTEIGPVLLGTDDDINAIDPQNELQAVCLEYGGQYLDFTPQGDLHLNPLAIPEDVFYAEEEKLRNQFQASQVQYLNSFCVAIMENIIVTQEHKSIIGRVCRTLYQKQFAKQRLKKQPTLKDFRAGVREEMDRAEDDHDRLLAKEIYASLEEYTEGAFDMFAHDTNVDLNNRFTAFGLKNVPEENWEPVMLTVMHFLSNRIEYNQALHKATRLIVDETQVVCGHTSSANMLLTAIVTYRKFGGICTLALQNLTRALENPELRDMFSNCAYKCFLDQGGSDAAALSEIQDLSAKEFQALSEEKPGYGIMVWGDKVLLFDALMDKKNPLYELYSTNYHEKAAQAKQERRNLPQRNTSLAELPEPEETHPQILQNRQKELLCNAATLSALNLTDASVILGVEPGEARKILTELCLEGVLRAHNENGEQQYVRAG